MVGDTNTLAAVTASSDLAASQVNLLLQTMSSVDSTDGMITTAREQNTESSPVVATELWVNN